MGAGPVLHKAQMKSNKFDLRLHLFQNEIHHLFKKKNKKLNSEEMNCADCIDIEPSSLSHCPKGR